MGVSINRFMESLFLFPLKGSQLHSNQLLWIAQKLSADQGYIFPAIRLMIDQMTDSTTVDQDASSAEVFQNGTEMTCLLLYPKAFSYF
jgi:hypothetical protein